MWQWVARGNIYKLHSPDRTAFALRAHAAPSGECNYYVCVCVCVCVCAGQKVEMEKGSIGEEEEEERGGK